MTDPLTPAELEKVYEYIENNFFDKSALLKLRFHIDSQSAEIARLRAALLPAEQGGIHVRVNLNGVTQPEHFKKVINEIANDLEIQKQIALSSNPPS